MSRARIALSELSPSIRSSVRTVAEAGDCTGVRMLTGSAGFCLLQPESGNKIFTRCEQVIVELCRTCQAEASKAETTGRTPLSEQVYNEVQLVREKLSSGRIDEGEAARKLLMLVGPRIEMAVAVAAGFSRCCDQDIVANASKTISRIRNDRNAGDQGRHSGIEPNSVQAAPLSKAAIRRSLTCSWSAKLLSSTSPTIDLA